MTFANAIRKGFTNTLVFSGRARRPEYWWFFAFAFAGAFIFSLLDHLVFGPGTALLVRVFQLIVFVPFLAVAMRRMQDTGKPGWWVVIPSVVVVVTAAIAGSVSRQIVTGLAAGGEVMSFAQGGLLLGLGLAQVAAGALILWWMSRPTQPGRNAYGPEPRVRGH